jgi:hypothetical protein
MLPRMTRGVCLYLVGSFALVSLAGCGHGFFQSEEREPWRAEAEIACLKSGAVKESADLVRIDPINGPGICGAEFPLKVAALGENASGLGFANDDPRPPGSIGNQPRWPGSQPPPPRIAAYPDNAMRQPAYSAPSNGPVSLTAPGVAPEEDEIDLPPEGTPGQGGAAPYPNYPPRGPAPYSPRAYGPSAASRSESPPRLGPGLLQGNSVAAVGPVAVKPTATLACPIVSVLDHWLAESVQPAAMRWFGARVVEIKQISAYSCRGRVGDHSNKISEHAFGNALDIATFVLSDGRKVVVESGWHGLPEEQAFLHDVQSAACHEFTTVLAPGSNPAHYNHIHVDLRKRAGRDICSPRAISGDEVAMRAGGGAAASHQYGPSFTGSVVVNEHSSKKSQHSEEDEDD